MSKQIAITIQFTKFTIRNRRVKERLEKTVFALFLAPEVGSVKRRNDGGISKESMIVMITCVGFVVTVFFLLCLILYKRKKKYGGFYLLTLPPSPDYIMKLDPERSLLEQTNKLPYDAQWEFPRERVHIGRFSVLSSVWAYIGT